MTSHIPFGPDNNNAGKNISNKLSSNFNTISHQNVNSTYRPALEKSTNLGKRTCNEYKTIFEDLKYKANFKNGQSASITFHNGATARGSIKKEESETIKRLFSKQSRYSFNKKL